MIYFIIQNSILGSCKIGYTGAETPYKRLSTMQTGNPALLYILSFGPGERSDETALHKKHSIDRIRGEWFTVSYSVLKSACEFGINPHVPFQPDTTLRKSKTKNNLITAWLDQIEKENGEIKYRAW